MLFYSNDCKCAHATFVYSLVQNFRVRFQGSTVSGSLLIIAWADAFSVNIKRERFVAERRHFFRPSWAHILDNVLQVAKMSGEQKCVVVIWSVAHD